MSKRTPLYEEHLKLNAKIVEFGGWDMPVQYTNVMDEHHCTRSKVGLFDICHMGEFELKGKGVLGFLQKVLTNDISKLEAGRCMYSCMCYEDGGVVDDLFVYKMEDKYMLVVNAGNIKKDFEWFNNHKDDITIINKSDEIAKLDLQGPLAQKVLKKIGLKELPERFAFDNFIMNGVDCMISRTGYTAEDGFEIYFDAKHVVKLWNLLLEQGKEFGIQPIGLGARDTLRIEACYSLYGHEINEKISPIEAGIGFCVKVNKNNFIGKDILKKQKEDGVKRKLVCLDMVDRGIPREHYRVYSGEKEIGFITSGTFSPTFKKPIAMALLNKEFTDLDTEVEIIIRDKKYKAMVVKRPFYKFNGGGIDGKSK